MKAVRAAADAGDTERVRQLRDPGARYRRRVENSMFVGGLMIGSLLWTVLISTTSGTVTWLVVGVVIGFAQGLSTLLLPDIRPGQELEAIAT
jgi:hypothetical protein